MADVWRCPKPACGWEGTPGEMAEGGLVSEDCDGMHTRMCPLCGVRDGLRIVRVEPYPEDAREVR